jgi:ATP-dependent DNA ligase
MVDSFLEQLTTVTKDDEQSDILSGFLDECTPGKLPVKLVLTSISLTIKFQNPVEVKYAAKLIDHDLKINIGAKFVLSALHPKAFDGKRQEILFSSRIAK